MKISGGPVDHKRNGEHETENLLPSPVHSVRPMPFTYTALIYFLLLIPVRIKAGFSSGLDYVDTFCRIKAYWTPDNPQMWTVGHQEPRQAKMLVEPTKIYSTLPASQNARAEPT